MPTPGAGLRQTLDLLLVPSPHVTEHEDQPLHEPQRLDSPEQRQNETGKLTDSVDSVRYLLRYLFLYMMAEK